MLKKIIAAVVVAFVTLAFVVNDEPKKIKFASIIPSDSPWDEGIGEYLKLAEKKSGNSVKFKTYYNGQLGGEVEMIKSVAMGTIDGGAFTLAALSEALSIPLFQIYEMPFIFNDDREADYVMDKTFDFMAERLEKKGLVLIMWGTNGWRSFGTKGKPVQSPVDLKGLKMRSQESDVYVNFYKALSATPVPMATPEVVTALKTGLVDGYDQTPVFSISTGWAGPNTCNYFTLSRHIYQPGAVVISKKLFNKLTDDQKAALIPEAEERINLTKNSRRLIREDQAAVVGMMPDFNVKVVELTKEQRAEFKKATEPVYTTMEEKLGASIFKLVNIHKSNYHKKFPNR